ncbi:MAG: 5-formyltetrahydrofolate cyclo-ligase [Desulfococcaceae bacterium]
MDEIREKKASIRDETVRMIRAFTEAELRERIQKIEAQLLDFANFIESSIPLLYLPKGVEVPTENIIRMAFQHHKIVVLPAFSRERKTIAPLKVDDFDRDLKDSGPRGVPEPDPKRCKKVPMDRIDIAIVPGVAFDEKGGRIGTGTGYYDRVIPKLAQTTRKVALAYDDAIYPQVPMESHDKFVDIIVTDKRVIYKI